MGQLLRHLQPAPLRRRAGRARAAQPVAVGHRGRVHLPVPGLLPVPLARQVEDGGGAEGAQGGAAGLVDAQGALLPSRTRGQVGHQADAPRRGGWVALCRVAAVPDARLLLAHRAAADALPARRLPPRAADRWRHRLLFQGPLHARHRVPHHRLLLRGLGLPDEPPLHRRHQDLLEHPLLHRADEAVPHALVPVRADPQEERADVRPTRHRLLPRAAAPDGRPPGPHPPREVCRPHVANAVQQRRPLCV
mmetsp:Transcript_11805/g.20200  ORF Transcript_11805/g.20200 Transcript_11805/m.20200 type:complete len:249 (-) Transcript_11805:851-1597(-)